MITRPNKLGEFEMTNRINDVPSCNSRMVSVCTYHNTQYAQINFCRESYCEQVFRADITVLKNKIAKVNL